MHADDRLTCGLAIVLGIATASCSTSAQVPDRVEELDGGVPSLDAATTDSNAACSSDMECGDHEYCASTGACTALPTPGAIACAGGTNVTSACNQGATAAALVSCAGAPGASACPYCRDGSCYWPMSAAGAQCASDDDCHRGDRCVSGLCKVDTSSDPCPSTVSIQDVIAGRYGAGKEVCIEDVVVKIVNESDSDFHVRMGNVSYPGETFVGFVTEPTPQYVGQGGLALPAEGQTVRCHGMVRWDQGHKWWELHPVDWYGPTR